MAYGRNKTHNYSLPKVSSRHYIDSAELLHNPIEWTERWHEEISSSIPDLERLSGLAWCFERLRRNGEFLSEAVRFYRQLIAGDFHKCCECFLNPFNPEAFNNECIKLRWQMRMAMETCAQQIAKIMYCYNYGPLSRKQREPHPSYAWFVRLAFSEYRSLKIDYENLGFPTLKEVTRRKMSEGIKVTKIPPVDQIVGCGPMPEALHQHFRYTKEEAETADLTEFFSTMNISEYHSCLAVKPGTGSRFSFARALDYGDLEINSDDGADGGKVEAGRPLSDHNYQQSLQDTVDEPMQDESMDDADLYIDSDADAAADATAGPDADNSSQPSDLVAFQLD